MHTKRWLLGGLILIGSVARADFIVLEPDEFSANTIVTNAWADHGIKLSAVRRTQDGQEIVGDAVVRVDERAVTGDKGFGSSLWNGAFADVTESVVCKTEPRACGPRGWGADYFQVLKLDFLNPIDMLEISGGFRSDPIGAYGLNHLNEIVATCFGEYAGSCFTSLGSGLDFNYGSVSLIRPQHDIYSVIIGGVAGVTGIDTIRVNIPEPATLALFAVAFLSMACFRLNRRKPGVADNAPGALLMA